ncbi:hypothetical protein GCM10010357_21990 [Streptomyces luteireticuli]|uniref:Uncharacterized protein n=1 Tax=Streptomyces luteireticuli TaxID=173858 RepID=A0ABN0YNA3_9ACTN
MVERPVGRTAQEDADVYVCLAGICRTGPKSPAREARSAPAADGSDDLGRCRDLPIPDTSLSYI